VTAHQPADRKREKSATNGHITKQDLRDASDEAFTRFSQHVLHEVGVRFDEVATRLESIDSRRKLQAGLIQSALARKLGEAGRN
jgi:hypothetical protein